MHVIQRVLISAIAISALGLAQAPAGRGRGPARPVLSVTSPAFPDGGEVPMHNAGRGENKSPAFEFHWSLGNTPTSPPERLESYAVVLHDMENSSNKATVDTLHWTAFNIPGTATGMPEGLGPDKLADGTQNGPGINARDRSSVLFRTRRRPRPVPSLCVRVLCARYEAGSAGERNPR